MLDAHALPREDDPERPFRWPVGPLDPRAFFAHRRVVEIAFSSDPEPGALFEEVIALLDTILAGAARHYGRAPKKPPGPRAREAVRDTQRYLVESFFEGDTLDDLGRRVDSSRYHLARAFCVVTGMSIHDYRERLRVLYALEHLETFDWSISLSRPATRATAISPKRSGACSG